MMTASAISPPIGVFGLCCIQSAAVLASAWTDLLRRTISNRNCLVVALAGAGVRGLNGSASLAESLAVGFGLFLVLLVLRARGMMGGGDVKLLTAAALGQGPIGVVHLIQATALAGGGLALCHLALRRLPPPRLAPVGASLPRRAYAAERWRACRRVGLPYGIAIATGAISTLLTNGLG